MSPARRRVAAALVVSALAATYAGCTTNTSNPEPSFDAGADSALPSHDAAASADGHADAPSSDSAIADTSVPDSSTPDTSVPDAGAPDTSAPDANLPDAAQPDAGAPDTSVQDTSIPDSNVADGDVLDTSTPDTSTLDAHSDSAFPTTANLLLNGDAESGTGAATAIVVPAPSWTTGGNATVLLYGASGGYPLSTDPGPADRGLNFFSGGPSDAVSTLTQHVDLAAYAAAIAAGNVTVTLSGYFGGYASQDDNAVLSVTFLDGASVSLGTASVGPVLAADRGSVTGLIFETSTRAVPAGTVSVDAILTLTRVEGTANDGYADDLSLVLTGN